MFLGDTRPNYIKELRQSRKMPQQVLCKLIKQESGGELSMPQSQLSDIENYNKPISLAKAQVIAKIFNVSLGEVINLNMERPVDGEEMDSFINLNMFTTEQLKVLKLKILSELSKRGEE